MARKAFSLEHLAKTAGPGFTRQKETQEYYDEKAGEATDFLASQIDKITAESTKRAKGLPWWAKTILNVVNPVLGTVVTAADTKRQQDMYSSRIKDLEKEIRIPQQYKGTFMEDYIRSGWLDAQAGGVQALKGLKQSDLLTGVVETALSALPAMGQLKGPQAATQAGGGISVATGAKGAGVVPGTTPVANPFSVSGQVSRVAPATTTIGPTRALAPTTLPGIGSAAPMSVARTTPSLTSAFTNLSKAAGTTAPNILDQLMSKLQNAPIPIPGLGMNVGNFTTPFLQGDFSPLMQKALTPSTYTPALRNYLMDFLTQQRGEPLMSELQAPRMY